MPIIGRQCTRDGKTVCLRMSESALPVNQSGTGLTMVYGWSSEERRAQGLPASFQGIELGVPSGKRLAFDYCPWCGAPIASSAASVRNPAPASAAAQRQEPPAAKEAPKAPRPPVEPPRPSRPEPPARPAKAVEPKAVEAEPASTPAPQAQGGATSLKALRERLGLSQAELGAKLGLARSSMANYENGRAPLSQRLRKWMEKQEKKHAARE